MRVDREVQILVVEGHADVGRLAGRLALERTQLDEGADVGRRLPDNIVDQAVDGRRRRRAHRGDRRVPRQQTGRDLVKRRSIRIVSGTVAIGRKHDRAATARDTLPLGQRDGRRRGEEK